MVPSPLGGSRNFDILNIIVFKFPSAADVAQELARLCWRQGDTRRLDLFDMLVDEEPSLLIS
jgi:hypothetical protein